MMVIEPSDRDKLQGREKAERDANQKAMWDFEHGGKQKDASDKRARAYEAWIISGEDPEGYGFTATPFKHQGPHKWFRGWSRP